MVKNDIETRIEKIIDLLKSFKIEKDKLVVIHNFLYDIETSCSSKFSGVSLPFKDYNIGICQKALSDHYGLKIYTHLESLYTSIIRDFDSSYKNNDIRNIKIESFLKKIINNTSEGGKIDITRKSLIQNIANSSEFDSSNQTYSIINNYIEWRGANAHFSIGGSSIDLDYSLQQMDKNKNEVINLYDKLCRYLNEIKNASFTTEFEDFK